MLNRSASLAMLTSILKALPGKLDIKRHSPSILYICRLPANGCRATSSPEITITSITGPFEISHAVLPDLSLMR